MNKKTPLYLQTDIGGDIDDFWALAMLLKQPWLDLRMVLTDTGHTVYRAAIVAKLLELAGRDDIVVGAGLVAWPDGHNKTQGEWVKDYDVRKYRGYTDDGIGRFIEMVKAEPGPVTLVAIGPATSLAEALRRAPEIAGKINFVGMFGSVYKGYNGKATPDAEYNVYIDVAAAKTVFSANWLSAAITPLDTCGLVRLEGDLYKRIEDSADPIVKAVAEAYHGWLAFQQGGTLKAPPAASSVLFDTVAMHMASSYEFLKMEEIKLVVDDKGFTRPDPAGKPFNVAVDWTDLKAYCNFLVDTLLSAKQPTM